MSRNTFASAVAGLALAAVAAAPRPALSQGPGPGYTPMGREGAVWQTEHQLQKEQIAELEARLRQLDLDGWKEQALAWVAVEWAEDDGERFLSVPEAFHVKDLDAGRKAEVDGWDLDYDPNWEIRFAKKTPRDLTLVLTDERSTRIDCPFGVVDGLEGQAHLGVFVQEGAVHCMARTGG